MGSIHQYPPRQNARGKCEVVDVRAELEEWREGIPAHDFYEPGTAFSRYEPSLLFAYDCYLQYHQLPLGELLQTLERKYEERFDRFDRLNWHRMEALLKQVWRRMGGALGDAMPHDAHGHRHGGFQAQQRRPYA